MNNNSLIETKQNIFRKIKNFFKNLFKKNNIVEKQLFINKNKTDEEKFVNNKEEFFNLYKKIKNDEIDIFSIEIQKLKKICKILEEECDLKEKRLEYTQDEIDMHKKNIMYYNSIAKS